MYADLLQDAGAPQRQWRRAQRIARALQGDPRLVLVAYCPAEHLQRHVLRLGRNWFIPAPLTQLDSYPLTWWPLTLARAGFRRYPSNRGQRRGQYATRVLLAGAFKTPFDFSSIVAGRPWVLRRFFVRHARLQEGKLPSAL